MRNLTKQEMSNVTGAMLISCFIEDGFAWDITGSSSFEFDNYRYYPSYVKDDMGRIIFSGHEGQFENSAGKTCYVFPSVVGNGNSYLYLYEL